MQPTSEEIIKRLENVLGLSSERALSLHFGYSESTIANRRRTGGLPLKEAMQIAIETGVSLDWLVLGIEGADQYKSYPSAADYVADEEADPRIDPDVGAIERSVDLPYHDQRVPQSMLPDNGDEAGTIPLPQRLFDSIGVHPARCAVMRIGEETMGADYQVGDLVIYENADEPFGGVCVVALQDRVRLRRVHVRLSGRLRLHCDGDGYDDEDMDLNPVHGLKIIGRVVATIRMRR